MSMKKQKILVIDYGVGNHQSVINALKFLCYDFVVSGKKEDCLVSITAITGNDRWFNLPSLSTLTADYSGVKIEKRVHH